MKILLADPTEAWCDTIKEQFDCRYQVLRCADGADVMPMLFEHRPDLLVLGLDLPHIDGLTLLRMIRTSGIQVKLLVTATVFPEYVLGILSEFGVSHMILKPCAVCTVMTQIYQMLHYEDGASNISDPEADLLILGLRMNLSGFDCLRTAICLMREQPNQSITKELYPNVSKVCGGTPQRVERAIRNVIRDAWLRRDERIWIAYFTPNRRGNIELPSNGDFIARIALTGKYNRACG